MKRAAGALGGFDLTLDGLRQIDPTGRDITFGAPRDGARTGCDVILDLTGGTPLFPAHHKRDGYLRPDPKPQVAVADAILEASQFVGTFEKVLHVRVEPASAPIRAPARPAAPTASTSARPGPSCPTASTSPSTR